MAFIYYSIISTKNLFTFDLINVNIPIKNRLYNL